MTPGFAARRTSEATGYEIEEVYGVPSDDAADGESLNVETMLAATDDSTASVGQRDGAGAVDSRVAVSPQPLY